MKVIVIALIFTAFSLTSSNPMFRSMMDLISTKPASDQFKLWHYVMQRTYDLTSEEAKIRFTYFRRNLKKYEEINSKNLGFTVGLGLFSDIDFSDENFIKIVDGTTSEDSNRKIDFDLMADIDDNETTEINNKRNLKGENDWSYLFEVDFPLISFTVSGGNLIFCGNHSFQHCFAHTVNANAKNGDEYNGNASPQFYRNCVKDGVENCQVTTASQLYLSFDKIPLEKNVPWTKKVSNCENPPAAPYYQVKWTRCNQYTGTRCTDNVLKGFLTQGPYMSQMSYSFATLNYTGGVVTTDQCTTSGVGAIVVEINDASVKARPAFGDKYGEKGFIRIKNEVIGHPEISCGLKSFAYLPDVSFVGNA